MLFGYKPSKIEADAVMSSVNPNTSGVSLEGFLSAVKRKKEARLYRNEIRQIFTAFDVHYRGFLTLEDFKRAFSRVAPKLPARTVLEVFRLVLNACLPWLDVCAVDCVMCALTALLSWPSTALPCCPDLNSLL
eukprot:XP_011242519.1 PREDICTED: EF-hand calcium-binding domain-containing protein 11 isoform X8 [Mus musculus]